MWPEPPNSALRLAIDDDALRLNWQALDRLSGAASAAAAVKADGYGLGARRIVPVLQNAGCTSFLVAHWSEAAQIADLVDPGSVSVLHGPLHRADADYAIASGFKPVINTLEQARLWNEAGGGICDVMVDTGINRLGLSLSDLADETLHTLSVDVLMSHLASADEDVPLNETQRLRWQEARAALPHLRSSLANSAGIMLGADFHGDITRPGLALYGGIPRDELVGKIRQVARPQAAIMQVRAIGAGDGVGYNSTFVAQKSMRVGTVALGYADGYLRCWSDNGFMQVDGKLLPVLGRVSMDMTVIDLSDARELDEGDWVEAQYSLPEASTQCGLSQYELLTVLGQRFAR